MAVSHTVDVTIGDKSNHAERGLTAINLKSYSSELSGVKHYASSVPQVHTSTSSTVVGSQTKPDVDLDVEPLSLSQSKSPTDSGHRTSDVDAIDEDVKKLAEQLDPAVCAALQSALDEAAVSVISPHTAAQEPYLSDYVGRRFVTPSELSSPAAAATTPRSSPSAVIATSAMRSLTATPGFSTTSTVVGSPPRATNAFGQANRNSQSPTVVGPVRTGANHHHRGSWPYPRTSTEGAAGQRAVSGAERGAATATATGVMRGLVSGPIPATVGHIGMLGMFLLVPVESSYLTDESSFDRHWASPNSSRHSQQFLQRVW
jgi:hypothetical protein